MMASVSFEQVADLLRAAMSPSPDIRSEAERMLEGTMQQANLLVLLQVIGGPDVALDLKQIAAIYLKNAIKRQWYSGVLDASLKPPMTSQLLQLVPAVPAAVQDQLLECLRVSIQEHTSPDVVHQIVAWLDAGNSGETVMAALKVMRILARKYEYRDEEDAAELDAIVAAVFPKLIDVFHTGLADVPGNVVMLRVCCKIYYSVTYMDMPSGLDARPWMEGLFMLAAVNDNVETRDVGHAWWKMKKWVFSTMYRYFSKHSGKDAARVVGMMDAAPVCMRILHATISSLSLYSQGHFLSPRVANTLLNILDEGVRKPAYWSEIQPHISQLIQHVVIPMLAFDDLDQELWDEDPEEYIRKGYDIIEDIYSPKTSAVGLLCGLCGSKKKNQLDSVMAFLAAIFRETSGVNVATMTQAQARKLDGAIYGVGSLASILQKNKTYKPQIPSLFQTYILPTFASPYGHVRAKACWVSSEFASALHTVSPEIFMQLLQHMQGLLNDPELPVQVDAAIAMREFFSNIDEDQVQQYGFLQVLPSLLAKFLELANSVDSEGIMETIECVVDKFGEHIGPYAFDVASALVAQFWKIVNVEDDDGDVFTDSLAGHQVLGTIATVLEAVSKSPEILAQMEGLLFPIFDKCMGDSGMDVIEEMLEIITQLTFYSPAISERMWTLFPRILAIMPTWGVDFFQEFIPVVDNFISRGTPVFVQQYLPSTNAMLEAAIVRFQTSEEGDGFGTEEEVYSGVAEIIQVILENCKGLVDHCVKPYTSLVVAAMMKNDPPNEPFEDPRVIEALLIAGADALYYNPILTMNAMQENGHLAYFMQALGQAVSRRKKRSGKLYHFASKREKKTVILGLSAVMATPPDALMPGMRQSIPQISAAAVAMLMDLKKQEEASIRPGTGASGMSARSQPSEFRDGSGRDRWEQDELLDEDDDDYDDDYDDDDEDGGELTGFLAEMRKLRGTSGGDDWEQDESLDDLLLSLHEDDQVLISPLDDVCAYTTFKEACARLRGGDEAGFVAAVGILNDEQKAWLEQLLSSSGTR